MKNEIFIVQPIEFLNESKIFFGTFNKTFDYLVDVNLKFTPEYKYPQYDEDYNNLKVSWIAKAEIIDTRELSGYEKQPVRLILSKDFFTSNITEQYEIILHEIGHYITNVELLEIRNFIGKENPKKLGCSNIQLDSLVDAHNQGLNYVFQILKLIQEVNAELWCYENQKDYCNNRLKLYCDTITEFLNAYNINTQVSKGFFYEIPQLVFLILWRKAIIRHTSFDFSSTCIDSTNSAYDLLMGLANKVGWGQLKLFTKSDEILTAITYKNENIEDLKRLYLEIFDEYITESSKFFPEPMNNQIRPFYSLA